MKTFKVALGSTWHHFAKMAIYSAAAHFLGWLSINTANGTIHVKWVPMTVVAVIISYLLSSLNEAIKQEKAKLEEEENKED